MRMVMVAAEPPARSVLTAAGVVRALPVMMADDRILADSMVADTALAAVPVGAALRADAALGTPVLTTQEPVAAIELVAVLTVSGHGEHPAILADVLAALFRGGTDAGVADLAVAAVAVITAFGTVAGLTGGAAH
jgi:hypothetical protein